MVILNPKQISMIEKTTISEYGISMERLIENAGLNIVLKMDKEIGLRKDLKISLFVGKGNNGCDGLVAARHFKKMGMDIKVYLMFPEHQMNIQCRINLTIIKKLGIIPNDISSLDKFNKIKGEIKKTNILIDAIFGLGLSRPITGYLSQIILYLNSLKIPIISVDIPSGLN